MLNVYREKETQPQQKEEESNQSQVCSLRLFGEVYHKDQTKQRTKNSYNKIGRPQLVPGKQVPQRKENGSEWTKRSDKPQNDQKNKERNEHHYHQLKDNETVTGPH